MSTSIEPSIQTAADQRALEMAMGMSTPEMTDAYERIVLEKWQNVPMGNGKTFNWLGDQSVEKGFPEIKTEKDKRVVAMLLENQLRYQRSFRQRVNAGGFIDRTLALDTQTGDEALPTNFALAMVRRAYALLHVEDWSTRQPLPGPTGYVFYMDFLREQDGSNILSSEYNAFLTGEAAVPQKAKISLKRDLVQATKQLLATTWTLEAGEDAMAQMGVNIEQELISEFTAEFMRNLFQRHLLTIYNGAVNAVQTSGTNLPGIWQQAPGQVTIPAQGTSAVADWKQAIYNALISADATYVKLNRRPATGIVAGVQLAARLQMANTATQSSNPSDVLESDLGIADYGHFSGRFHIWSTDLLPDNVGFLYRRNADTLRQGHIYSPYVPIQVMPAVYAGMDASGRYTNTDEYTRNIRERSADKLVKPYAYVPLVLG